MAEQIVGTDYDAGRKVAAPLPNPKFGIDEGTPETATPTVEAHAEAAPVENTGQTLEQSEKQVGDVIQNQIDAQQRSWVLNAGSQHELDAMKLLDTAQRQAQPGQMITPLVQDALKAKTDANLQKISSPLVQTNYQNEVDRTNKQVLGRAQAFDFKQRDDNVVYNYRQGLSNNQNVLALLNNPADIESKFNEMMAGAHENIAGLQVAPDIKLQLLDETRKGLVDAANTAYVQLNPKGFLARNTGTPKDAISNFASTAPGTPISFVQGAEGSALVANDGGKGMTKYGVNKTANPDVDVANLTPDAAKQILQTRYIDKVVTSGMSPQFAMVAGDAAVNMGVSKAKDLISQADGDPQKLIDLRRAEYQRLAKNDPDTYAQYLPGWMARMDSLQQRLPDVSPRSMPGEDGQVQSDIGGWSPMRFADWQQRNKYTQLAQQYSDGEDADAAKAQGVKNAQFNSDFAIALGRGQKTYQDIEDGYAAGNISPVQRKEYTEKLDEFNGNTLKDLGANQRVNAAISGQGVLDPKNEQDKKAVDRHFQTWLSVQPQPQNEQDKAVLQAREIGLATQYGMLPQAMAGQIRGGLRSNKPEENVTAANTIAQLRQQNPVLLNDIDANDLKAANHVLTLTGAGYSPAAAVGAAQNELRVTPEIKETREKQADQILNAKGWLTDGIAEQSIKNAYTTWNPLSSTPNKSFTAAKIPDDMMANWNAIYKSEFIRTGNPEAAKTTANDLIVKDGLNSGYGKTAVGIGPDGSSTRWLQNAPETHYAAPVPIDQSKWMNEQLVHDVQQGSVQPGNYSKDNLQIVPSQRADENGNPTYNIWHLPDNGGAAEMLMGKTRPLQWKPDWDTSQEKERYNARIRYQQGKGKNPDEPNAALGAPM